MLKKLYYPQIGHLMADSPKLLPAAIFYGIYAFALAFFVVVPGVQNGSQWYQVLLPGALFGFAAYATYDLTNQATLKNWPVLVTIADLIWGSILTGVVSWIATLATRWFVK
jgi:uncharacterized membrane protein